jgi:hypothetical protein
MQKLKKQLILLCAVAPVAYRAGLSSAQVTITGTTPFSNTTPGGYAGNTSSLTAGGPNSLGSGGYEVGNANYYFSITSPTANGRYSTGFILTSSGTTNLGLFLNAPTSAGSTPDTAKSITTSGSLVAGLTDSYVYENSAGTGTVLGNIEAVWTNSGGTISLPVSATDNPAGYPADGPNNTSAFINNFGTLVGGGTVYNPNNSDTSLGNGSFVWFNSGTAASPSYTSYAELLAPQNSTGSIATGAFTATVLNIGDSGLAVGSGSVYNGGTLAGNVAVTWNTNATPTPGSSTGTVQSTIPSVLLVSPSLASAGSFGGSGSYTYNSASGSGTASVTTTSVATFVNASNVIAGTATVYDSNTAASGSGRYTAIGSEPILWNGAGSTGTFLPLLSSSYQTANIAGINAAGDIIGNQQGTGLAKGVLWKAGSSYVATLLAAPTGTNPLTGTAYSTSFTFAKGENDYGDVVGYLGSSTGDSAGTNALLWTPNGAVTDLNSLVTLVASGNGSTAGWVSLLAADAVTNQGWISGVGVYYDPNASNYSTGALPNAGDYYRPFLLDDPAAVRAAIYGTTPLENNTVGGYTGSASSVAAGGPNSVGAGGIEIGNANYYSIAPTSTSVSGDRYSTGYILTPSGTVNLGTFSGATATAGGAAPDTATSINTNGTLIAGYSDSYHYTNGSNQAVVGNVEAVWNSSGGTISLPVAVTDNYGDGPNNTSGLINNHGTVVGNGTVYNTTAGTSLGSGAFVWTNSGTVASPSYTSYAELLSPSNSTGSISTGSRTANVIGISDSGLAVGAGSTYNGSGTFTGNVAVTWDTTSTPTTTTGVVQPTIAPVLLISPSLASAGSFGGSGNYTYNSASGAGTATITTTSQASFINASNVIAGTASIYDANTAAAGSGRYTGLGSEPIVWNGAGSTGSFLPLISTSYQTANVSGINAGGDIIGNQQGTGLATAVIWKAASSYAPTVLAAPTGTNPLTGTAYSTAFTFAKGVNDDGYSVGYLGSSAFDATGTNALLWSPSGVALDLNKLVTLVAGGNGTTAGWVSLLQADAVTNQGWISGLGIYYDPNATDYSSGAFATAGEYYRPFLIDDAVDATPEPASLSLLVIPGLMLMRRRRRSGHVSR